MSFHYKLRNYQRDCISFLERRNVRGLVNLCPGAGKTAIAMATAYIHDDVKKMLVVAPCAIKLQWMSEVKKCLQGKTVKIISGGFKESEIMDILSTDVVIINYDILNRKDSKNNWYELLARASFDMMIVDEAQRIANHKSLRSIAVGKLSKVISKVILLSGTPINRADQLWHLLHVIKPDAFPSYWNFIQYYCPPVKKQIFIKGGQGATKTIYEIGKPKNTGELYGITKNMFFSVDEKEVYKELEELTKIVVPVDLTNTKEYIKAEETFYKSKADNSADIFQAEANFQKARKAIGMGKLASVKEWIEDHLEGNDKKLVVFFHHREVGETIQAMFKDSSVLYYGGMSTTEKDRLVNKFIKDSETRIFFGSVKAAGEGLDGLNTVSNTALFLELPYTPSDLKQASGRIRRINSTYEKYFAYYFIAEDTLDEHVMEIVDQKAANVSKILNGEPLNETNLLKYLLKKGKTK